MHVKAVYHQWEYRLYETFNSNGTTVNAVIAVTMTMAEISKEFMNANARTMPTNMFAEQLENDTK